jgi:hypothetical protein
MKKIIGVIAILLTLALSIIYRQLTGSPSKICRPKLSVPTVIHEVQENLLLASLTIQ